MTEQVSDRMAEYLDTMCNVVESVSPELWARVDYGLLRGRWGDIDSHGKVEVFWRASQWPDIPEATIFIEAALDDDLKPIRGQYALYIQMNNLEVQSDRPKPKSSRMKLPKTPRAAGTKIEKRFEKILSML